MPGASTPAVGNESNDFLLYLPSVAVPNVSANSSATQTVTASGVLQGDLISWNQQGVIAGLAVDNIYVSAANTLSFYWTNTTGSNINNSANQSFLLEVVRGQNTPQGLSSLPAAIE